MGKRITAQRRGKGSSVYKSPSHKHKGKVKYRIYDQVEKNGVIKGKVVDIFHSPGRSAPIAQVKMETGEKNLILASEGMKVGDELLFGSKAEIAQGNILPLASIPEGTPVSNIENTPGDGGKLIRASGSYGIVVAHEDGKSVVKLPSGKSKILDSACRAMIGIVAGGGRKEKPVLKAGKMWHMLRSKARYWPIVGKVAMNPVAHPHGGGSRRPGRPTSIGKHAPPGRKVGLIAPKRTGKR